MKFSVFELERVQSLYENTVEYNLTESGFHPYTLKQLLSPDQLRELEETVLGYGQTNGSAELRQGIAALYPEQGPDNVLVTNDSSESASSKRFGGWRSTCAVSSGHPGFGQEANSVLDRHDSCLRRAPRPVARREIGGTR